MNNEYHSNYINLNPEWDQKKKERTQLAGQIIMGNFKAGLIQKLADEKRKIFNEYVEQGMRLELGDIN